MYNIAIVGATGLVGNTLLRLLLSSPLLGKSSLRLYASNRSHGENLSIDNNSYTIEALDHARFDDVDIAFFCVDNALAKAHIPKAIDAGCGLVIDNSSAFRYDSNIPLIIPEINGDLLNQKKSYPLIANPNCSTAIMLMALYPVYRAFGISRIIAATYQAVSGSGYQGIHTLDAQLITQQENEHAHCPIAFNVIPKIDALLDNGYTREEMKLSWESQKILSDHDIHISATTVRVPVYFGHSLAVSLDLKTPFTLEQIYECLRLEPNIVVSQTSSFPTPRVHAQGCHKVYVGRIRKDHTLPQTLHVWVTGDNMLKGAAYNALQIAEHAINSYDIKNKSLHIH